MTLELGICLSAMALMLMGICIAFVRHGVQQPVVPWPIGPLRRLRDRVWRHNVCAAAQAATLAGDPKFAKALLGRYGLDLCPGCAAWTPLSSRMWTRQEDERYTFISVCHKCFDATPAGWQSYEPRYDSAQGWSQARQRWAHVRRHTNGVMYRAYEDAQIAMAQARVRFAQSRVEFRARLAEFRRRLR